MPGPLDKLRRDSFENFATDYKERYPDHTIEDVFALWDVLKPKEPVTVKETLVVLVAIEVATDDWQAALNVVQAGMEDAIDHPRVEAWWIAEDERGDNSDNMSAVLVKKGTQDEAVEVLHHHGQFGV